MVNVAIRTICDMVDHCRLRLDDVAPTATQPSTNLELIQEAAGIEDDSDQLWSDRELRHFANEAIREVAQRTLCLRDGSGATDGLTSYAVAADTALVTIDPRVLVVKACYWDGVALGALSERFADEDWSDWRTNTAEAPTSVMLRRNSRQLRLVDIPTVAGTLTLDVIRLPLEVIDRGTPEIPQAYLADCINWMCHLAYLKSDADTYDPQKAERFMQLFDVAVGPRRTNLMLQLDFYQQGRRRARAQWD